MAVALAVAGGWPEDEPWPSSSTARAEYFAELLVMPEPPRAPRLLPAEEAEQLELHRALGVGRGRR